MIYRSYSIGLQTYMGSHMVGYSFMPSYRVVYLIRYIDRYLISYMPIYVNFGLAPVV